MSKRCRPGRRAINARRYDEATAALDVGAPYAKASMNTTIAISKLRKEIGA